jgi:hypothetical protein
MANALNHVLRGETAERRLSTRAAPARSIDAVRSLKGNTALFLLVQHGLLLTGCTEDADVRPTCLDSLPASCTPLYPPTFDQIYSQTLSKKCSTSGSGCHGPKGNSGGLSYTDADSAYVELAERLTPGDPSCSEVVVRVDSSGHDWSMPPGKPLSIGERCAIRTWIAQGAQR